VNVLVPLGTRPEIIKLAPVVAALRARGIATDVVATGQHYDAALTDAFFADLGLHPDVRWHLDGSAAHRVGAILEQAIELLGARRPDVVVLLGDTNTVPLFCLAARRFSIPIVHVEAGLRSHNPVSLEEANRRVAGTLAALHFAPTALAAEFLTREGVPDERIRVVGNPIIDVLRASGKRAQPIEQRAGVVMTAHRASNVDDPERLEALVTLARRCGEEIGPVVFPLHPRTRARLDAAGSLTRLERAGVQLLPPVAWDRMLDLVAGSRVVVTDSGGLQEEAAYFGVPVVVLRTSTPRWEGVEAGTSVLTGLDADRAAAAARALADPEEQARIAAVQCPYGDGHASERIARVLADPATAAVLTLAEPDLAFASHLAQPAGAP
jgi:UDP-N-acetylglucosamine 2-epimerase (non-hydrolysing)